MTGRDLEVGGQRRSVVLNVAGDVEEHATIDQQVGRVLIHGEVGPDTAAPEPARIAGCRDGVDAAEEQAVPADVAQGVDTWCSVLAAPLHDLRGERQVAVEGR